MISAAASWTIGHGPRALNASVRGSDIENRPICDPHFCKREGEPERLHRVGIALLDAGLQRRYPELQPQDRARHGRPGRTRGPITIEAPLTSSATMHATPQIRNDTAISSPAAQANSRNAGAS
jgi:hypothetical protein